MCCLVGLRCADTTPVSDTSIDQTTSRDSASDRDLVEYDAYVNPCKSGPAPSVKGKVLAPNGLDPVSGATVYVPRTLEPIPTSVRCEQCAAHGTFMAETLTSPNGEFELKEVPGGTFTLVLEKGYFRRVLTIPMRECGQYLLTKEQGILPGKTAHYGPHDAVPKLAVITGAWDKMEKVLGKLGVEEVTLFNGKDQGTGPQSIQALLSNGALMKTFHRIFVNCGVQVAFENLVTSSGPARNNLRDYVRQGGRLFVTDYAYDFIEQVFPEFIDFEGGPTPDVETNPEPHQAAELGTELSSISAEILDEELKAWLSLPEIGALNGTSIQVLGLKVGWAVPKSVSKLSGKVWVQGNVKWVGGQGVRPLTASYYFLDPKQGCGRITFSSYHTWGNADILLPQERVLEFLALEIGQCMRPD